MKTSRIEVKQVLRRSPRVDHYFGNRYSFSPYRACSHACLYCDGRAEKYYVEGDFNSNIIIRANLIERLKAELPRLRERGFILAGSGVTDAYQPLEAKEKLMSRAAQVLLEKEFPVIVISKSILPERDLPLWKKLNEKAGFILILTLCTLNDPERSIFEPGAPAVEERLKLLDKARAAGITTAVTTMPLLPLIWDSEKKLKALFSSLKSRTDYILPGSLTLRPGIQKDTFMRTLSVRYPELLPEYHRLYGENRLSGSPVFTYQKEVYARIFRILRDLEIPHQMPHRIFREKISLVDEVHIILRHLEELYRPRGIDTRPVREAEKRYAAWLSPLRKEFNRKRSLPSDWLGEKLRIRAEEKQLGPLFSNSKLESFMEKIILEPVELDYITLKLSETQPRKETNSRLPELDLI